METADAPQVSPFDHHAQRYDDWFASPRGAAIFQLELDCLRLVERSFAGRWLEVGVGTGRFAQALSISHGVDPSRAVLEFASRRGVAVLQGCGEDLPYLPDYFNGVLLVVTICFLDDPLAALTECVRVLAPGGVLIAGLVPADSPWGLDYQAKAAAGHPFYSAARFYRVDEMTAMAKQAGFSLHSAASTLFSPPSDEPPPLEQPQDGIVAGAGFVALRYGLD